MVGNNHFPGQARIEFQAPLADARLADPEGREEVTAALRAGVAAAVADDLPVFARSLADARRVVHLGALHAAPCGGTHVRSLGDLADVVLPTLKVKKGRIRVSYAASHASYAVSQVSYAATHLSGNAIHASGNAVHVSDTAMHRSR
ncbi:hypothetical protein ACIPC1_34400 [Streptomyces sp. NPDC087263]|uniref:hypothetical protein n=1 Tax=Streptomyces sp. NPDC087263 TaxID=3365773 RepID=UPI0037F574A4